MKKIYSATITPFTEEGEIDKKSLEKLLKFNLDAGIEGFFFFGSMGEWALFNSQMRFDLLETATDTISERAEIIAGIHSTGLNGILENIEAFSKYSIDSYALMFPGGWAGPRDPVTYMHRIADFSNRPLYLYYVPTGNGIHLSKEQLKDILSHNKIIGIKNSSDSSKTRKELLILKEQIDFLLFEGQEWVVDESLFLGCDGALVGMGSLGAKLFKGIARDIDNNNFEKAKEKQSILINIFDCIYGENLNTVWIGQKYALKLLGIFSTYKTLVPAEEQLNEEDAKRIENCIERYKKYLI